MLGYCFWRRAKADTLLRLRGARSRFEGPIGSFSMYVCGLGDVRALFFREAGSDSGLRPPQGQKSVLEHHGGFLYVHLHRGAVVALFLERSL